MVTAGKIFVTSEPTPLDLIAHKIKGYKAETPSDEEDFTLATKIENLEVVNNRLRGDLIRDVPLRLNKRGTLELTYRTFTTPFAFERKGQNTFLLIVEKKPVANAIANMFSTIVYIGIGGILEAEIPPEVLEKYQKTNSDSTKVVFFDRVNIPNINKLSLYGPSLSNTTLYEQYLQHGKIWYVVVTSKSRGYIVGVTRDSVVTVFNRLSTDDFMNFCFDEILQLIASGLKT
jgi:hypothetical protein